MKLKILFTSLIAGLLIFTGCDDGVSYDCPSDINQLCRDARNSAKACIESKLGRSIEEKYSCSLEKNMNCTKKASSGYWCWWSSELNAYVGGLYYPKQIFVGCNPANGGEVHSGVVKHEYGHHWIYSNKLEGQNSLFKSCFMNWEYKMARQDYLESVIRTNDNGVIYIADILVTADQQNEPQ